jgi:hypothetical protein
MDSQKMKKSLFIVTIFGSVICGLILLSGALAAPGAQPPSSSPAAAQAECDCSNLEDLQIELRNALKLQQAFRNKIPELRAMEMENRASMAELERWAKSDARRGLEPIRGSSSPAEVDYKPWGDGLKYQDDERVTSKFKNEELCRKSDESARALEEAKTKSACAGIAQALQAHEDWHLSFCLRIGYRPYWLGMRGADRAQEEVEAYGAQIKVLRAEIAKMLERASVRVEYETNVRLQFPPNPAITAEILEAKGVVPMSRVSVSGDLIKLDGEGTQTTDAKVEGSCRFTGGVPYTLTARGSIETDGLEAQIRLTIEGKGPSLFVECEVQGAGKGHGMSLPVKLKSDNVPVINLPLKNGAEQVLDQSTGEAAKMMAQAGAKLSGQAKIRLILCEK